MTVAHLLVAMAFAQLSSGLQGILIPIRADLEGYTIQAIGLLGTAYYFGFVVGCLMVPALVRRVGHIRAFAGCASLAAAAFLLLELLISVPVWVLLRAVFGFCFAGLYMAVESWLNGRSTTDNRGRILAAYMVVGWAAVVGGKLVFAASDPAGYAAFAIVSVCVCLAVLPVAFTSAVAPSPVSATPLKLREVYRTSPVGLFGCFCVGAANGAFWALSPVYGVAAGLSTPQVAIFVSAAVLGGAALQWPLGRWSDRTDRRHVIVASSVTAAAAALLLAVLGAVINGHLLLTLAAVFGAGALPVYALCVAHANDQAPPETFVELSSDLLMVFGVGAVAGPLLAAALMNAAGHGGVFLFTAGMHGLLIAFTLWRTRTKASLPPPEKSAFVVVPAATQAALPLDPRSEPADA